MFPGQLNSELENEAYCKTVILTYILADYLSDSKTANSIMEEFDWATNHCRDLSSETAIQLVFEECQEDSPMYRFVRDMFICYASPEKIDSLKGKVPEELFYAIAREVIRKARQSNPRDTVSKFFWHETTSDPCRYHLHDEINYPRRECPWAVQ